MNKRQLLERKQRHADTKERFCRELLAELPTLKNEQGERLVSSEDLVVIHNYINSQIMYWHNISVDTAEELVDEPTKTANLFRKIFNHKH